MMQGTKIVFGVCLLYTLLAGAVFQTEAVHSPACPTAPKKALFGIPKTLPLDVRGGAVEEPQTLDDVDALILKAGSEGKLVVIDFSGACVQNTAI